jgi:hypothetical protein
MAWSNRLRQIAFFTRLRASGNFNPKCALKKGRCAGKYTKQSAKALDKTEFASTNKKSKNYGKMLSLAKKNTSASNASGDFHRGTAVKALTAAKGRNNKISHDVKKTADGHAVAKSRARGTK